MSPHRVSEVGGDGLDRMVSHMLLCDRLPSVFNLREFAYVLQFGDAPGLFADRLVMYMDGSMAVLVILPDGAGLPEIEAGIDRIDQSATLIGSMTPDADPLHESVRRIVMAPGAPDAAHMNACLDRGCSYIAMGCSHEDAEYGRWLES